MTEEEKVALRCHLDNIIDYLTNDDGERSKKWGGMEEIPSHELSVGEDLKILDRMINKKNVKGILAIIGDEIDAAVLEAYMARKLLDS